GDHARLEIARRKIRMTATQVIERFYPAVGRLEVAPGVQKGIGNSRPREVFAFDRAFACEAFVGALEKPARLAKVERQAADAEEVGEPRISVAPRLRHGAQPLAQSLIAPLAQQP